jgi:hypothetical protein
MKVVPIFGLAVVLSDLGEFIHTLRNAVFGCDKVEVDAATQILGSSAPADGDVLHIVRHNQRRRAG